MGEEGTGNGGASDITRENMDYIPKNEGSKTTKETTQKREKDERKTRCRLDEEGTENGGASDVTREKHGGLCTKE